MAGVAVRRQGNLPAEMTSLVGRRAEVAEVKRQMGESRLVTLTGVGGVGKTRLALSVARASRRVFGDGVWLVELAELAKPDLLILTVVKAVGVPVRSRESLEDLMSFLREKQLLIVLDNCEHLVDVCARLVHAVLQACPQVRFLATSREPLRISGEVVFGVPPLSLPSAGSSAPGDEARYDAINLFGQRASAVVPDFAISDENRAEVVALCRQLDGLPLAIELAAVRVRSMSVPDMLARQQDRYGMLTQGSRAVAERHQTLRAAVDWSYELCSESERTLWARLAVFSGGVDLAAADAVWAGGGSARPGVLDPLSGLVERSILGYDGTQYRMLETIRDYGLERLRERGEESELRHLHRDYCLSLARRLEAEWFGPDQADLLADLQRQHANLRSALDFCLTEPGQSRNGLALASALWAFWIGGGHQREGTQWLDGLLAADTAASPERAAALWVAGYLLTVEGQIEDGLTALDECRDLAERVGEPRAFAHATYIRGLAELFRGNTDKGAAYLEEGVALEARVKEFNPHLTVAMVNLGLALCYRDSVDRSIEILEECRTTCVACSEQWMMSWSLLFLGLAHWVRGHTPAAETLVRDALRCKRGLGDLLGAALAVDVLAWVAWARGQGVTAAKLLGASRAMWGPLGAHLSGFSRLQEWSAECVEQVIAELGQKAFDAALTAGAQLTAEQAMALALDERDQPAPGRVRRSGVTGLTARESQVAGLVAEGLTNRDIANTLVLSVRTVDTHVEHILSKLGFTSRAQIAAFFTAQVPHPPS